MVELCARTEVVHGRPAATHATHSRLYIRPTSCASVRNKNWSLVSPCIKVERSGQAPPDRGGDDLELLHQGEQVLGQQ
ncbi:MAG TPA: hypothetical protein VGB99_12180, partial [Acidobacteriota bacterium]